MRKTPKRENAQKLFRIIKKKFAPQKLLQPRLKKGEGRKKEKWDAEDIPKSVKTEKKVFCRSFNAEKKSQGSGRRRTPHTQNQAMNHGTKKI